MESVPVVFEDVVCCNVCNVDRDRDDRGYLKGTEDDALAKGWKDLDWGLTCPQCQGDLDSERDSVVDSGGLGVLVRFLNTAKK